MAMSHEEFVKRAARREVEIHLAHARWDSRMSVVLRMAILVLCLLCGLVLLASAVRAAEVTPAGFATVNTQQHQDIMVQAEHLRGQVEQVDQRVTLLYTQVNSQVGQVLELQKQIAYINGIGGSLMTGIAILTFLGYRRDSKNRRIPPKIFVVKDDIQLDRLKKSFQCDEVEV